RSWLTRPEAKVVIMFVVEVAARGWPECQQRVKEHVDMILHARQAVGFPAVGVGKNWVVRFMLKHSNQIKMADSRPLEDKHGRGVNPTTNGAWFGVLGGTVTHHNITRRVTFGTDELGVLNRGGERERVVTSRDQQGPQYQQKAGTRDNTTVIVTICADGNSTDTPPAVIFKGATYQVDWVDDNPLNAL
ncbi:hypothetical protein BDN72DRAFT_782315, partial [Pluteus cervinus]